MKTCPSGQQRLVWEIQEENGDPQCCRSRRAYQLGCHGRQVSTFQCLRASSTWGLNKTGLFWKKMHKRTYIMAEEKALLGHKPMKDRITLLFCANTNLRFQDQISAHLPLGPSISITHRSLNLPSCENPRARPGLPVTALLIGWPVNSGPQSGDICRTIICHSTPQLFLQASKMTCFLTTSSWRSSFCCPTCHPISNFNLKFKKLYMKGLFQHWFKMTGSTNLTLREFWKDHFHIVACLKIIDQA